MLLSLVEATDTLRKWKDIILSKSPPGVQSIAPDTEFDNSHKIPNKVFILDYDGALIVGWAEPMGMELFSPVLTVTEYSVRPHIRGVGHRQKYVASTIKGVPNFTRCIRNAVNRSREISRSIPSDSDPGSVSVEVVSHLPKGMLAAKRRDGTYNIHIGTVNVSKETLCAICKVLS